MKSLEIVNQIYKGAFSMEQVCYLVDEEELQQIKQDLEVLEIIRKKKVDVDYLVHSFNMDISINAVLEYYNHACLYKDRLTLEELLKLKHWLERGNVR